MTDSADNEHDLATQALIELYSEIPPPSRLVTGHFHSGPDYHVVRPGGVGSWCAILTVAGTGRFRAGGHDSEVRRGDLTVIRSGTPQDYATVGGHWEHWWAHFQPRREWHDWWTPTEHSPGVWRIALNRPSDLDRALSAFTRLHLDAQRAGLSPTGDTYIHVLDEPLAMQLALNGIEEILLTASASLHQGARPLDSRVRLVLDVITEEPAGGHTLRTLAAHAQVSESRLAHLFKQQVGETIMNVLASLRMQRALQLLLATDLSIAQIATAVGYESPHYFSRQFRRHFDQSPRAYRRTRQPDRAQIQHVR